MVFTRLNMMAGWKSCVSSAGNFKKTENHLTRKAASSSSTPHQREKQMSECTRCNGTGKVFEAKDKERKTPGQCGKCLGSGYVFKKPEPTQQKGQRYYYEKWLKNSFVVFDGFMVETSHDDGFVCKCEKEDHAKLICNSLNQSPKPDSAMRQVVDEQANDEGLWCETKYASEAYLQEALRRLHEVIEGKSAEECARAVLED